MAAAPFELSRREASLLLARATGLDEAQLIARTGEAVDGRVASRFRDFLERRVKGEPVAYLFGEREFYGRMFAVDPRVLIPRPETEHLIETVLELGLPARARILDVGTGSGCIAVTLALELPQARVVALDSSPGALAAAAANARRLGASARVTPVGGDLISALRIGDLDLVVSNPPYVDPAVRSELSPEITGFEPATALFGGEGGAATLDRLLGQLGGLRPRTPIVLEIGHDQADAVAASAARHGHSEVTVRTDLAGRPRVALLRAGGSRSPGR